MFERLSNLKEFYLVQTAEFSIAQGIDYKLALSYQVKHALKIRDRITTTVRKWQTRYLKKSHKFGIERPECGAVSGPGCQEWQYLMGRCKPKELENFKMAFEILPNEKKAPIGHYFVQCHMVIDIKIENFKWEVACGRRRHNQGISNYFVCLCCAYGNSKNSSD